MKDGSLGYHRLLDYHDCDSAVLDDLDRLRTALVEAVRRSGATLVTQVFHRFNPHGISGVIVIAESHVALHTWPEHGCAAVDIFSCSERMDCDIVEKLLREAFRAKRVVRSQHARGVDSRHGVEVNLEGPEVLLHLDASLT